MRHPIFDKLLTVRILRTDKAQRKMMRCKAILAQARHLKHRKDRELVLYRAWRQKEELRLLDELKQAPRPAHALILFKDTVHHLRDQEVSHVKAASEAARQAAEAEHELETARREYAAVYRKQVKIETCQDTWSDEQRLIGERESEKETESCMRFPFYGPDSNPARSF